MPEKNWKQYWLFYIILALFIGTLIFATIFYSKWNQPIEESGVEVNLPIIEWDKYVNLSKQYENGTIDR